MRQMKRKWNLSMSVAYMNTHPNTTLRSPFRPGGSSLSWVMFGWNYELLLLFFRPWQVKLRYGVHVSYREWPVFTYLLTDLLIVYVKTKVPETTTWVVVPEHGVPDEHGTNWSQLWDLQVVEAHPRNLSKLSPESIWFYLILHSVLATETMRDP